MNHLKSRLDEPNNFLHHYIRNQKKIIKNKIIYLDVMFPILFSYEENDELYLSYVITHDEFESKLNVITTKVKDYNVLEQMVESSLSIFDIFDEEFQNSCTLFGIDSINELRESIDLGDYCDKYATLKEFHDMDLLIEDLLPEDDFYLTPFLPNKQSLSDIKKSIKIIKKRHEIENNYFMLSLNSIDFTNDIKKVETRNTFNHFRKKIATIIDEDLNRRKKGSNNLDFIFIQKEKDFIKNDVSNFFSFSIKEENTSKVEKESSKIKIKSGY